MTISEVLNLQQRRARKMLLRRIKGKIKRGRAIARRRMASPDKLRKRSAKKAREVIRKKVAGQRGAKYAQLPLSARMQIDKQVEKRKSMIQRLAKRMMPKVRKAERERLAKVRSAKKESYDYSDILSVVNRIHDKKIVEKVESKLFRKLKEYDIPFNDFRESYEVFTNQKGLKRMDESKYENAVNFFVNYHRKYGGDVQRNLVQVARMINGIEYRKLEQVLHDLINKRLIDKKYAFRKDMIK